MNIIKRMLLLVFSWLIIVVLLVGIALTILYIAYGEEIYSCYKTAYEKVLSISPREFEGAQTSIIYDSEDNAIMKLKSDEEKYYLRYSEIPDTVKNAFIAIEDKRFFEHNGIDLFAIVRAGLSILSNKGTITQGGSTITQQLVKNMFLSNEQTIERKITEIFMAMMIEDIYTKEDILEFYINNISYANNCYGIASASEKYFGKDIRELTKSQMIYLCAIPQSPAYNDPLKYPQNTLRRRDNIIRAMLNCGFINLSEANMLQLETVELNISTDNINSYLQTYAHHDAVEIIMEYLLGFTFKYDLSDLERELYDIEYAECYEKANNMLKTQGYTVKTSLSQSVQDTLQKAIDNNLSQYMLINEDDEYEVQAAATLINNDTGLVVAIVGGRTPINHLYTINRAYQTYRQSGSAIKPLVAYIPYFSMQGNTPNDTVRDTVEEIDPLTDVPRSTNKLTTIRTAIKWSYNGVPWNIVRDITPKVAVQYLKDMRFHKIVDADDNEAIALGGFTYGVTTTEMAEAFAVIARRGTYMPAHCVKEIINSDGLTVYKYNYAPVRIYDEFATVTMTDCLQDVVRSGTGMSAYFDKVDIAAKTGTTNDDKDSWFVGYTPYYTLAVWSGYDTPTTDPTLTSNHITAHIFKETMLDIHNWIFNMIENSNGEKELRTFAEYKNEATKESNGDIFEDILSRLSELSNFDITSNRASTMFTKEYSELYALIQENKKNLNYSDYILLNRELTNLKTEFWKNRGYR